MKKIINKVKQFRVIGYVTIGIAMHQRGFDMETMVVEMFLLILLTELGVRGTKVSTPDEYKEKIGINKKIK